MAQKRKLQVFVASTYLDLVEERQAAVEAILNAGHLPVGMELFAAGAESQMIVLKHWIDESDVFMLILGGRYGSIEPKTGKSYVQLDYEYALEKGKPAFAVVIDEKYLESKIKKSGLRVIERDNPDKLKEFRELVVTKMVSFWGDTRDIKLAIMKTLNEFNQRTDLSGWIPARSEKSVDTVLIAEELDRLEKLYGFLTTQMSSTESQARHSLNEKTTSSKGKRSQVFISYSHQDYQWLKELLIMLEPLKRNNDIRIWDDTKITPGDKWKDEIRNAITSAKVAVLLVSKHFLASDFIHKEELPPLLAAAENDGLTILWVAVSYCMWQDTAISDYQATNNPEKPLISLDSAALDKDLVLIAENIKSALSK